MAMKARKPIKQVPPRTLSEQEKQARIMQFLQQKRDAFAVNILNGLCTNMDKDTTNEHAMMMVDLSVEMADKLIKKLYPVEEESK